MNIPQLNNPERWEDYYYQERIVKRVKGWISTNQYPSGIFVTGSSGTGKTSLIKLLIKTVHCIEREDGEVDPCNKCKSCLSPLDNIYNNVIWVNPGSTQAEEKVTYQSKIKEALLRGQEGPTRTGNDHRDILFVIFDEIHLMPKDLLQQAMCQVESGDPLNTEVVYIFITMSPEKIDSSARIALQDRGSTLYLKPPSQEQIVGYLLNKYSGIDVEVAKAISKVSRGSLRRALSTYHNCREELETLNLEEVCEVIGLAPSPLRKQLWIALRMRQTTIKGLKSLLEECLSYTDAYSLVELLIQDLEEAEKGNAEDILAAYRLLTNFLAQPNKELLLAYIRQLMHRQLVDENLLN